MFESLIYRKEDLKDEKKRAENLLYRMIPQTIADKLTLGHPVDAELFPEVVQDDHMVQVD